MPAPRSFLELSVRRAIPFPTYCRRVERNATARAGTSLGAPVGSRTARLAHVRPGRADRGIDPRIARGRINEELARRGLRFRPAFWLSEEWFSPDGVGGVAMPFYLAHPRLTKLEQRQMLAVEGGTRQWCLRNHAARSRVTPSIMPIGCIAAAVRRELFGSCHAAVSRVLFAEALQQGATCCTWIAGTRRAIPPRILPKRLPCWLRPRSRWRRQYAEWPALEKLRYVDELMNEIAPRASLVLSRLRVDSLDQLKKTLREHYEEKAGPLQHRACCRLRS